jgi:hypothetical protein
MEEDRIKALINEQSKNGIKYSINTLNGDEVIIPFLTMSRPIGARSTSVASDGITEINLIDVLIHRLGQKNLMHPSEKYVSAVHYLKEVKRVLSE